MTFRLSARSMKRLDGVNTQLVAVVEESIKITDIDFMVIEGLRMLTRQADLVKAGASKTMRSKHLIGHAVDIAPIVGGKVRWDWPLYHQLAEYFRQAARIRGTPIIWGACWDKLMNDYTLSPEDESYAYAARRRALGKRPFLDGPHFELSKIK